MDTQKVAQLQELIDASSSICFFGGAGVSTESGIPDFRSVDGLYHQKWDYPPETILSATFFAEKPAEFYRFYREKLIISGVKPNAAHLKLAELEAKGKLGGIVTQNIDGLHQAAGNKKVWELHGSTLRNYCTGCRKFFDIDYIAQATPGSTHGGASGIPVCDSCGAIVKPDVVLYEEGLNEDVITGAINCIAQADLLIIGGTSLTVYPAAGLINYYRGKNIVLINRDPGQSDYLATLVLHEKIGEVFSQIVVR